MLTELQFSCRTISALYPSFSNTCNTRRMQSIHNASPTRPYMIERMRDNNEHYSDPHSLGSAHQGNGGTQVLA